VLAMHPNHENCYAPGQVLNVSADLHRIKIRFYDFVEAVVDVDDCQPFHKIKFQNDINGIISAEKKFIGKYVIARNSIAGLYDIGKIGKFRFLNIVFFSQHYLLLSRFGFFSLIFKKKRFFTTQF
jgi:hypothetical protein